VNEKFNAPFVGVYNQSELHNVTLRNIGDQSAEVRHVLDETAYSVFLRWEGDATVSGPLYERTHTYLLRSWGETLRLTATFAERKVCGKAASVEEITEAAERWWGDFWEKGAFVDLTATGAEDAREVQRRVVLSQYLVAVNSASDLPPQGKDALIHSFIHISRYIEY